MERFKLLQRVRTESTCKTMFCEFVHYKLIFFNSLVKLFIHRTSSLTSAPLIDTEWDIHFIELCICAQGSYYSLSVICDFTNATSSAIDSHMMKIEEHVTCDYDTDYIL